MVRIYSIQIAENSKYKLSHNIKLLFLWGENLHPVRRKRRRNL